MDFGNLIYNEDRIEGICFSDPIFLHDLHLPEKAPCKETYITSCHFEDIEIFSVTLPNLIFINCTFNRIYWQSYWVPYGLKFSKCIFTGETGFVAGGHNKAHVIFEDSSFEQFADFCDSWFMDKVIFSNVNFIKGTNLLSQGICEVSFDEGYDLVNCSGDFDVSA